MVTNETTPEINRKDLNRPRVTPYQRWRQEEGVPNITGSYVADLHVVDVHPWPRTGQKGVIINLADQELDDAWLIEIAPQGKTEPMHHMLNSIFADKLCTIVVIPSNLKIRS